MAGEQEEGLEGKIDRKGLLRYNIIYYESKRNHPVK